MSWDKPKSNGYGGIKTTKDGHGSLHSKTTSNGQIDRNNHVHFHKDGVTITKDGKKNTIYKPNH